MVKYKTTPVFIHSLFRAGSTYMFNVFRRSGGSYWCYQEPLNEYLLFAGTEPDKLLEIDKDMAEFLRHTILDKPYFYEFHVLSEQVGELFQKKFSYDQYFFMENENITELKEYFSALLKGARGRPVFQCCRTAGRVGYLKNEYGGEHIFLWRNPWDQWWSYKLNYYFDRANLLIANALNAPPFLVELRKNLNIPEYHNPDIFIEFEYFDKHRMETGKSYKLFYALWCHAMLEARPKCDMVINVEQLSESESYRNEIQNNLKTKGLGDLDFSDCSIPTAKYGVTEGEFFHEIEVEVHALLLMHGYSLVQIDDLVLLSEERKSLLVETECQENHAVRDAMRARQLSQQFESEVIQGQKIVLDVEHRARQAELLAEKTQAKLDEIYNSRSWRMTRPFRNISSIFRKIYKSE